MDYRDANTIERERARTTQGYVNRGSRRIYSSYTTQKAQPTDTPKFDRRSAAYAWMKKQPGFAKMNDEQISSMLTLLV